MLRLVFTGQILAILTATVKADGTDELLQPWTFAGPAYDYSDDLYFGVGVFIQTAWVASFTNATIALTQDNNSGDARGGPSMTLEGKSQFYRSQTSRSLSPKSVAESYNKTTWGWTVSQEGMDPAYNNVFYFAVTQANGTDGFIGHYFNISAASVTTKSSASSGIMTSQLSSSATVTGAPVTVATSWATVTVAPSSGGETPMGTMAGIVVGIVIGSLLLVGGTLGGWKRLASSQSYFSREQMRYEADGDQIYEVHESAEAD